MKSAWRRHLAGPAAASDPAYSLSNAASCACNPSSVAPGALAACGVTALRVKGGCSAGRGLQMELVHSVFNRARGHRCRRMQTLTALPCHTARLWWDHQMQD